MNIKTRTLPGTLALAALGLFMAGRVVAGEQAIGEPFEKNGMQVGMVYLQAVTMEPSHDHHGKADIHLEADVKALAKNPHGFPEGAWIPSLEIGYEITKAGDGFRASGKLHPMAANDGPHYGDNVKLAGPGKYKVTMNFKPPAGNFFRHTDKETGIPVWWAPFSESREFVFVGSTGKKGGY